MEFEEIYKAYFGPVYCYLLRLSGSEQLAEELTAETFFRALRAADGFRGGCEVRVWLCQIARHLWYAHLRRRGREVPLEEDTALPAVPSAEEMHLADQDRMDLLRRIHALPEPGREVVYLRAFGSLSFREIGELLGRTETWARVTFYRSKEHLKTGGDGYEK